jgi:alpha-methylacyl-CoA racemase
MAGIGPVPHAGMLLSDLGADLIRIDRRHAGPLGAWPEPRFDILARGRRSIIVDLKKPKGVEVVLDLIASADALIEGYRPGVMEKLGLAPRKCMGRNPRLVYGRMTGWGQEGPLAEAAGHDINYISLSGALHAIGKTGGDPAIPLNLVGDFGGGSLYLALGVVSALLEASRSGKGQVVDAAMVDGAASLMSIFYSMDAVGALKEERGANLLDGGAHFYNVYETKDGGYVSVGAIEPQFYAELLDRLGMGDDDLPSQFDQSSWSEMRERMAAVFRTRTRDQWCELLEGSDACFAPVVAVSEASDHRHMTARKTFVEVGGVKQPAPAPRFSRTRPQLRRPPPAPGADTRELLSEAGMSPGDIEELLNEGVVDAAEA